MGQYHYVVNVTKKQYLHPHRFGEGLKLLEFGCNSNGIMLGLALLLARDNGQGGGDLCIDRNHPHADIPGSWAGDRIVIAGDYGKEGVDAPEGKNLHHYADKTFEDISGKVILAMCGDEYVRRNFVKGLVGGFACDSEENKALLAELSKLYPDTKKLADKAQQEYAAQTRKWEKEREKAKAKMEKSPARA